MELKGRNLGQNVEGEDVSLLQQALQLKLAALYYDKLYILDPVCADLIMEALKYQ